MLKLYFGSTFSILSTALLAVFVAFFWVTINRQGTISNWGVQVLLMMILGVTMSFSSGMRDGMGSPASVIPTNHWAMTVLCVLGGLAFLIGIVTLFVRKQDFWQIGFFLISFIIIAKVLLTEGFRLIDFLKILS
jgi:hypothetical protein